MKASISRLDGGIQLSYSVAHTIYDTGIYPLRSSDGSLVIAYGHNTGVRIVWCASKDVSDHGAGLDDADLKSDTYPNVLQHVDIPLPAATLRIACPNIPHDFTEASAGPPALKDRIVLAAACADRAIRLVSVLLNGPGHDQAQIVEVQGGGHQDLISSLAITYTADSDVDNADTEVLAEEAASQKSSWSFLVASVSCTGTGLLLVHQVSITKDVLSNDTHSVLLRRHSLQAPCMSAKLTFNTSPYPAERNSTLLLVLPEAPCVKLYQVLPKPRHRARRGSVATTDSASSTRSSLSNLFQDGKFLITLLSDFSEFSDALCGPRRRKVLDAKWTAGGRAVIALFEDGVWGIWDIEGVAPSSKSSSNPIKGQAPSSGIVGGSCTKLAVTGRLMTGLDSSTVAKTSSKLAPQPTRADDLFQGSQSGNTGRVLSNGGSIDVVRSSSSKNDEAILFTFGQSAFHVPSLLSAWKSSTASRASLAPVAGDVAYPLPVQTGGDILKSARLVPTDEGHRPSKNLAEHSCPAFLAATNTKLMVHITPVSDPTSTVSDDMQLQVRSRPSSQDQSLLKQGSLDFDRMDRILEGMNGRHTSQATSQSTSAGRARPNFGQSIMLDDPDTDGMMIDSAVSSRPTTAGGQGRRVFS